MKNKLLNFFYVIFTMIILYILYKTIFFENPQLFKKPLYILFPLFFITAVILAALLFIISYALSKFIKNNKINLLILSGITFLPRLIWAMGIDTKPVSDFSLYQQYAVNVSKGIFNQYDITYTIFPFKFGYPLCLGFFYRIFGANLTAGKLFNVILSIAAMFLLWWISYMMFGRKTANLTALVYACYPSQIFYCSVLASEHVFMPLMLLSFALLIKAYKYYTDKQKNYNSKVFYTLLILSGVFIEISNLVRPIGMLYIPIVLIYTVFFLTNSKGSAETVKNKIICFLTPFIGYILVILIIAMPLSNIIGVKIYKSSSGFNMLIGTNFKSNGMYNEDDVNIIEQCNYDYDKIHKTSEKIAISRIMNNKIAFIKLADKKTEQMWSNDVYGSYWSLSDIYGVKYLDNLAVNHGITLQAIQQCYYFMLLILFLLSGWFIFKSKDILPLIPILFFMGSFAAYTILEVQSRYHYPAIVFLLSISGYGLMSIRNSVAIKLSSIK